MIDDEPNTNSPEDIGYRAPPPATMPRPQRRKEPTMPKTEEAPKDEGPRAFAVLLQQIGDGELHDELGLRMQELVATVSQFSDRFQREGKGTLTLVLGVTALGNGTITIAGDIKTKTPSAKRAGSVFFRTPGNNLSVENPRQQKLPLREVPQSRTQPKDLSTDPTPARGI